LIGFLFDRRRPHPVCFNDLLARDLHPLTGRAIVDVRRIAADIERRPRQFRVRRLTKLKPLSGTRKFDRIKLARTERIDGALQRGGARRECGDHQRRRDDRDRKYEFAHESSETV